jgi:hypothetical protein
MNEEEVRQKVEEIATPSTKNMAYVMLAILDEIKEMRVDLAKAEAKKYDRDVPKARPGRPSKR